MESCISKGKHVLNPIVDWEDEDVWGYIKDRKLEYCTLYDEGFDRLGCIGCPMAKKSRRIREFERFPKFKTMYLKAFQKMIDKNKRDGNERFVNETPEQVMDWWINEKEKDETMENQIELEVE
jgi:phosphoadenosine phosphosulfate reductase